MLNPNPEIKVAQIGADQYCYVIDDALQNPEAWVQLSVDNISGFAKPKNNLYPGIELNMLPQMSAIFNDWFGRHIRGLFGASQTVDMYSRLSMITTPPQDMKPYQWFCHSDAWSTPLVYRRMASVLYLFKDESFGGTSFYAPMRTAQETDLMFQDATTMAPDAFAAKHGIAPGYPVDSNPYFKKIVTIPPKWNRLVFYDGAVFHSSAALAPPPNCADPRQGRLTINGFYTCNRSA